GFGFVDADQLQSALNLPAGQRVVEIDHDIVAVDGLDAARHALAVRQGELDQRSGSTVDPLETVAGHDVPTRCVPRTEGHLARGDGELRQLAGRKTREAPL